MIIIDANPIEWDIDRVHLNLKIYLDSMANMMQTILS